MSDRGSSSDDSVDHQTCPAEQVNSANEVTRRNLTYKSLQRATCMDVLSGRVREEEKASEGGGRLNIYGRRLSLGQAGTRGASNQNVAVLPNLDLLGISAAHLSR